MQKNKHANLLWVDEFAFLSRKWLEKGQKKCRAVSSHSALKMREKFFEFLALGLQVQYSPYLIGSDINCCVLRRSELKSGHVFGEGGELLRVAPEVGAGAESGLAALLAVVALGEAACGVSVETAPGALAFPSEPPAGGASEGVNACEPRKLTGSSSCVDIFLGGGLYIKAYDKRP